MRRAVTHSTSGGALRLATPDPAQTTSAFEEQTRAAVQAACTCRDLRSGATAREPELQRVVSLLRLLAAWDRGLLRERQFVAVAQHCHGLLWLRREAVCSCRVESLLRRFVSEAQSACSRAHRVQLDLGLLGGVSDRAGVT